MVSVEPGLSRRWRSGSNALLLLRSPEDPGRVRAALTASLADIAALGPRSRRSRSRCPRANS